MGRHALVFGASGIIGWATVNALLKDYPTPDAFDRVTALTNRPLSIEDSRWPISEKLAVVSGLDLLAGEQDTLEETIRQRVPEVETVSHVYFFAYMFDADPHMEIRLNVDLLRRAVTAIENTSARLEFVVLPTGVKTYGVHLIDKFPFKDQLPLKESLPPIPEPFASKLFYYPQVEFLQDRSKDKPWTYCDIIPDIVVGFVPNNNAYCLAQWLALYLSLYREINGAGSEVVNDSNQDIIARFAIHASLHPETTARQRYNIADHAQWSSWSVKWPIICDYFGLRGVAPENGSGPDPSGRVGNDRSLTVVPIFLMGQFDFDRQIELTKMHETWGDKKEEADAKGTWHTAFDRFRAARIIP
ncbi:hypothetical protein BDV12DRAFT_185975 [Aspergillus spectabilis]